MSYPLINGALINGAEEQTTKGIDLVNAGVGLVVVTTLGVSVTPLEFGAVTGQVGVDVAATPWGIDLARFGVGVSTIAQPDPDFVSVGVSARPLELGAPTTSGEVATTGTSAAPLLMGDIVAEAVVIGVSATPLELGDIDTAAVMTTGASATPLELGAPSSAFSMAVLGLDLATFGVGRTLMDAMVTQGVSAYPLEFGDTGNLGTATRGRSCFPMQLGKPSISRGATC
jgi:hypothetical protein